MGCVVGLSLLSVIVAVSIYVVESRSGGYVQIADVEQGAERQSSREELRSSAPWRPASTSPARPSAKMERPVIN